MRSLGWNKGLGQDSCCKEDLYFNERLFQFKKPTIPSAGLVPVNFDIGSDCTVAYLCNFTGGSGSYEVSYAPGIVNGYPTKAAALASPRWISVINLADNGLTPNSVAWYAVRDKNNVINVIAKSVTIICANIPPTCFHTTTSTTTSTSTTTRAPDPPFFPISDFPLEKRKRFITRVRLNSSTGPIVANSKIITVTNLFSGTQLAQSFTDPLLKSLITTSQNQASQQKTISIIDTLPNLGIVDIPCADDRVYIYVIGSTTGTVYGGGTVNGVLTAYSEDSDIATAAVHAGIIRPGQIAYVKRQYVYYYRDATKISFFGENKNDITSLTRFEGCGFYFDPAGTIFPAAGPSTTSTTTNAPGLLPGLCRGVYGVNNILLKSSIDLGPILSNEPSKVLGNFDYPQEMYQIMWTGYFVPPIDDTFTFSCDFVDDTFYMWIGFHAERGNPYPLEKANLVVNINTVSTFSIDLKRGEPYPIRLLYLQALTVRNFNFQVSGINFLKTNDLDYMIYHDLCAPAFVSASVVPSSTSVDENLNPLTFTINTSGFPVGSNIYWYFDSVEAIDWTLNTNLGSYQSSTLTGFEANTSITAKAWAELVNLVYLRHLGRFPENVGTVDGNVSRLLAGQLTLDQLDTEVYASVEAASYRVAPPNKRRFGNITTTGTTMSVPITGTVVYDSRYEGPQTGNLLVRFESLSGVIIANSSVTINDTVPIHKDFDPIPTILYPGVRHQMSFFTLGSNYFANEPMKIKVLPAVGSGNVSIPASAFTISPATWTMPNANTHIHTFTIQINTPYTFTASEEYFRLGAHVGIAETLCAGTNNIKVMDNVVVTYPCPAAVTYQGGIQFPAQHRVDLGTNTTGTVKLTYTAYSVPDRFMVIHDGAIVADSGYVGSPSMLGDVNSAFGGWPSSHTIDGVTINHTPISSVGPNNQTVGLSFTKNPAVRYATVLIFAPIQGTAWECTLACPVPPAVVITLSNDSISEGGWTTINNTPPLPAYLSKLTLTFDAAVAVGTAFCANITGVSIRDINDVATIGTFQNTTIADAIIDLGNSSMTVLTLKDLINVLYIHYLGRFPENTSVVDGLITQYQGHKSLVTLDNGIKNSVENQGYNTALRQITGTVPANRIVEKTLIAVPDFRAEGTENGVINVSLTDCLSPVVASKTFSIVDAYAVYATIPWPYVAATFLNCANASNIKLTFAVVGGPSAWVGTQVTVVTYTPVDYYENGLFPLPAGSTVINNRVTISAGQPAPSTNSYELQFTLNIDLSGLAAGNNYFIGLQGRIDGVLLTQTAGIRIETDGSC